MIFKVPSNPNQSMILWYDIGSPQLHFHTSKIHKQIWAPALKEYSGSSTQHRNPASSFKHRCSLSNAPCFHWLWIYVCYGGGKQPSSQLAEYKVQLQRCLGWALQVSHKLFAVPAARLRNSCEDLQATAVCALRSAAPDKLHQALKFHMYNK